MRLLDINNLYSPTGGGVRTYHERRAAYHARRGDVAYALVVPSDHAWHRQDEGFELFGVPAMPLGSSGYRQIVRSRGLTAVLDRFQPDVVEVGSVYTLPRALHRTGRGGFATIGFYHADYPDTYVAPLARKLGAAAEARATAAAWRHAGRAYGGMTAVFGASEHVLRKLADAGVRRLFHTPLGVDVETFAPSRYSAAWRATVDVHDDRPVVLYAGRLGIEKGIDALLAAWPRVPGRDGIRLVIVGHGPLQGRVDAFAAAHDEVRVVGYLDGPAKVAEAMASSDVFVSLGAFETFSLTTLEALAAGAVVVAPRDGGAGELAGQAGMPTCDVGDADALASAIAHAVAQSRSHDRAGGAAFAASMTWDAAFDRMTCYQQRVLEAWRRDDVDSLEPAGPWHPIAKRDAR